ncbi:hypothetical protein AB0O28_27765 [Microbispora sp. NPDC088329]|uniref:hypothetical protein n=1 Tax=Microbispora sp. NPDC088329 TaxID=3154869 RepID=UPI0034179F6B
MKTSRAAGTAGLICALTLFSGCQHTEIKIDRTPMPTVAAPPYVCKYIPLKAVELMTGEHNPLVRGYMDLDRPDAGDGDCAIYQRGGDRLKVLQILLVPLSSEDRVKDQLQNGASPLPAIIPGAIGYYGENSSTDDNSAHAMLARGHAELLIKSEKGVEGRDNAADVVALMKLIAPKLIKPDSTPTLTPSTTRG